MTRLRPALALLGVTALLAATPCFALVWPAPTQADEGPAMHLLQRAASSALVRPWSAVLQVITLRGGMPRLSAVQVRHTPGQGTAMQVLVADEQAVGSDVHDAALLRMLVGHYDLSIAGTEQWAGRAASVLEARRVGVTGPGAVAGRFWLDSSTGLVLRRDVLDDDGAVVRSTTLDLIDVGTEKPMALPTATAQLDQEWLSAVRAEGWPVPRTLPGGLELFEARMHDAVLQLSYSDGLSTLSLFVQPGELRGEPLGTARPVSGGGTVWVTAGDPERIVWSDGGRTWTMLTDAPDSSVQHILQALPHTARRGDSAPSRVWRGMSVVGSWLNPFD